MVENIVCQSIVLIVFPIVMAIHLVSTFGHHSVITQWRQLYK